MIYKRTLLYSSLVLLIFAGLLAATMPDDSPLGQTRIEPFADMAYLDGTSEIPGFHIGISEEPNINYRTYLDWLYRVFYLHYPDVYNDALLANHPRKGLYSFNDPAETKYFDHPGFAYYPITDVTWLQVQDYLSWKTDRLNESLLIEAGVFEINPEQYKNDNFTLETFLAGIYKSKLKKPGYRAQWTDNKIMPGFRLPTEAEWEYAAQPQFQRSFIPNVKTKEAHPFTESYYTLNWLYNETYGGFNSEYYKAVKRDIIYYKQDKKSPRRLTDLGDFESSPGVLINMETNVKEWVLDEYSPTQQAANTNFSDFLQKNGFTIWNDATMTAVPEINGRMPYRIIGADTKGNELKIKRMNTSNAATQRVVKGGTWIAPGTMRSSLPQNEASTEIGFRCVLSPVK